MPARLVFFAVCGLRDLCGMAKARSARHMMGHMLGVMRRLAVRNNRGTSRRVRRGDVRVARRAGFLGVRDTRSDTKRGKRNSGRNAQNA